MSTSIQISKWIRHIKLFDKPFDAKSLSIFVGEEVSIVNCRCDGIDILGRRIIGLSSSLFVVFIL
jgi:hypothetical protein